MLDAVAPIVLMIAIGAIVAWRGVVGPSAVKALSDIAFSVLIPALLFRAVVRTDLAALDWNVPLAYFGSTVSLYLLYYFVLRRTGQAREPALVRAMAITFPNTVMLGIPVITVAYGEAGLAYLMTIIAFHAMIMMGLPSIWLELGRSADANKGWAALWATLASVLRHPVIVPIIAGILWGMTGLHLPAPVDQTLRLLGTAAPTLCLLILGASLVHQFSTSSIRGSLLESALKLVLHPLIAFAIGRYIVGLQALPLAVVTVTSSMATGANVVLFAQRYQAAISNASAAAASSTVIGLLTLPIVLYLMNLI